MFVKLSINSNFRELKQALSETEEESKTLLETRSELVQAKDDLESENDSTSRLG